MAEPNTSVIMASVMTVYCPQVPERISVPKAKYTRRMQAKAPALTTATACSSAVTGVGATAALTPDEIDAAQAVLPDGADLTYELSGNPQALNLAIDLTGDFGRVVIGSWYGRRPVEVDLGGRFHRAQLQLIGSQVSHLAPGWRGRWTKGRRLDVAWAMLRRHRPERLITHRLPLDRAVEAYRMLDEQPGEAVQIVFEY